MIKIGVFSNDKPLIDSIYNKGNYKNIDTIYEIETCSVSRVIEAYGTYDIIIMDIDSCRMTYIEEIRKVWLNNARSYIILISNSFSNINTLVNQLHPFALLCKPIELKMLKKQIDDISHVITVAEEKISFRTVDNLVVTLTKDSIYYFCSVGNHQTKIVARHDQFLTTEALIEIEKRIDNDLFLSPQRGFLVNIDYIIKIEGFDLYIKDGSKIKIADKKIRKFREQYIERFCKNAGE